MQKVIRLTSSEKKKIDREKKFLTLFYYNHTTVQKGEVYDVPTILKYGKRSLEGEEVLPKMSYKNSFKVRCIDVVCGIPYSKIDDEVFKYSLRSIKSVMDLKKSIKNRYLKSRPFLTKEDIEKGGVAYTVLEFLEK